MSELGSEVSSSEVSGDSGTTSDVSEVETGSEVSEGEMDDDLSHELDDSYDSYMEEGEGKTFESDFNEDEEVEETELDETDEPPPDDLESDLDNKYDSYIEEKDLSSFEKGKATDVDEGDSETDDLDSEVDNHYNDYVENGEQQVDNAESTPEHIKCRNENLEGQEHPETGVPFERRQVEVDGKQYEVVVPEFESSYDAKLPENMYEASDREQFKECNSQLKNEVATNKDLREQFDEEQLEQIENGDTPDGYTWHHDAEAGKMQLVDTETHQKTGHTGGRSIWGGGTESR